MHYPYSGEHNEGGNQEGGSEGGTEGGSEGGNQTTTKKPSVRLYIPFLREKKKEFSRDKTFLENSEDCDSRISAAEKHHLAIQ